MSLFCPRDRDQPPFDVRHAAAEMFGMCLLISEETNTIRVVGQELVTVEETDYSCNLLDFSWEMSSAVEENIPHNLELHLSYPNPFNAIATIRYDLSQSQDVTVAIYTILNQEVRNPQRGMQKAGSHVVGWNGRDDFGRSLASDMYICRIIRVTPAGQSISCL